MKKSKLKIKIALPDGHLQPETEKLFSEAGFDLQGSVRSYKKKVDGRPEIQIKILRPQEIPIFVERGTYHLGVTGWDWLGETGVLEKNHVKVKPLLDLEYGFASLVLAIPKEVKEEKNIEDVNDFLDRFWEKKNGVTIATEYINITKEYILSRPFYKTKRKQGKVDEPAIFIHPWISEKRESPVKIILSHGATEGKPPEDADAIVDNTSTRQTLKANDLIVIDDVLKKSTAWIIANKDCLEKKPIRTHICRLVRALHGAVLARRFLHLFANFPKYDKKKLKDSKLWNLAQQEITVVKADSGGARIDLLIESTDSEKALDSLKDLKAKDIVALQPRLAWPSKAIDEKRAPYLKLFEDLDCI